MSFVKVPDHGWDTPPAKHVRCERCWHIQGSGWTCTGDCTKTKEQWMASLERFWEGFGEPVDVSEYERKD